MMMNLLIWYLVGLASASSVIYTFEYKKGHDIHLCTMLWCMLMGVAGFITLCVAVVIHIMELDWSWTKKIVIKGKVKNDH